MHGERSTGLQTANGITETAAAAALFFLSCCCFCVPASAQSSQGKAPAVPTIKGSYVLTDVELCNSGHSSQITGLATFDTATGKLKLNGYIATGDPLTLNHLKQTLSYSNSTTTVTLGDTVYQVTYGKLANGIATYLSLIAAVDPCAAQIWLARQ